MSDYKYNPNSSSVNGNTKPSVGKNGFEIRADVLALAKSFVENQYTNQLNEWNITDEYFDEETNETTPPPSVPTIDNVLEVAGKMYGFVNNAPSR